MIRLRCYFCDVITVMIKLRWYYCDVAPAMFLPLKQLKSCYAGAQKIFFQNVFFWQKVNFPPSSTSSCSVYTSSHSELSQLIHLNKKICTKKHFFNFAYFLKRSQFLMTGIMKVDSIFFGSQLFYKFPIFGVFNFWFPTYVVERGTWGTLNAYVIVFSMSPSFRT